MILSVLAVFVVAAGATRLTIDDDFHVYFSDDNPQLAALEVLEDTFTKEDAVGFVILPDDGDLYDPETLRLIYDLTEEGWRIPFATRSSSLANHQHTWSVEDDLYVEALIDDPDALDAAAIERLRQIASVEPGLVGSLLAEDGSGTTVFVRLDLPQDIDTAADESVAYARELAGKYRELWPDGQILVAGSTATDVVLGEAVAQDLRTLLTLSYLVIGIGLLLLLRSWVGMLATVALITLSIAVTMGFFGWLGTKLTPVAGFVPSIVMTIAVADAVHVLVTYFQGLRGGLAQDLALREAMRINAAPIFITSITTVIGVLSLNFSDSPPYRALGNMVAVGVTTAWLLTMTFLPALLKWVPAGVAAGRSRDETRLPMDGFASWIIANRRVLLGAGSVVIVIVSGFMFKNELSERWFEYFDETFEYRRGIDAIDEHIGGIDGIAYVLDSGERDGVYDPGYLQTVEDFADWYREQPKVASVNTITNTLKRLNKNMHGDDPDFYRVPDRRDLAAQYLLLYELSLPQGLGLDTMINMDRSATRFSVITKKMDSNELLQLEEDAQRWLSENAPVFEPTEGTGLDVIFAHMNERNIRSMLKGALVALLLISIALILALRSARLGLVSLIPNFAPAALAYGLWGMFVGHINAALAVVITMSLGIVVDDTVHFLSKYRRARIEKELSAEEGIRYAFNTVGIALAITTAVLVTGFSVLAASHFTPTKETGTLLALTLGIALVVDFLFLPPLLLALDRFLPLEESRAAPALL